MNIDEVIRADNSENPKTLLEGSLSIIDALRNGPESQELGGKLEPSNFSKDILDRVLEILEQEQGWDKYAIIVAKKAIHILEENQEFNASYGQGNKIAA